MISLPYGRRQDQCHVEREDPGLADYMTRRGAASRRDLLRLGASASMLAFLPAAARVPTIYKDARAPVDLRVRDLMARMTLDEKVAQMIALWGTKSEVMA